ncbi:NifU family protein [Magnetospirillum molischianum]|uniref:Putative nifU protein (C-terminal) n=1 Tax=Magnetospirillum molischianum DSM 120 TaxID=1150626 RepID=H8FTH0_MAGML|nr:NifU family protein [Magnetospirillum molischianum]CCG41658.1 putative nifU protein (C-terminal fragment) [Magnetospirillum molischianum DSM 120]
MFIQTEPTPNPSTLKFLPGTDVMPSGTADFKTAESAVASPLASRLFAIDGIAGVFLAADFISVAKAEDAEWQVIKPQVLAAIMEHFSSGQPVVEGLADAAEASEDDALVTQIKELIETRVRPAVAQDGGDITFRGFRDGIVYLHLQGACSGCPSASATLKHGIENMLKYYVPEVQAVQAVA